MATNQATLENAAELFFSGDGQQIYHVVQFEADITIQKIQQVEKLKEIEAEKSKTLRSSVKAKLDEASKLRFELNTVDRKIVRERNTDPLLRKHYEEYKKQGIEPGLDTYIDILDELEQNQILVPAKKNDRIVSTAGYRIDSMPGEYCLVSGWDFRNSTEPAG